MIQIPLTPDQYKAKVAQLAQEQGVKLKGTSGTVSKLGVTLDFEYDGALLTVEVKDKPFLISEKHVEAIVSGWLTTKPAPKVATAVALVLAAVFCLCAGTAQAQTVSNLYAGGVSYNKAATPTVAGTVLYARAVSPDTTNGMKAFTVLDVLPTGPTLNVTTNVGVGIAEKVATIGSLPIYVPTDAGVTLTGSNAGWNWSGGVITSYRIPNKNLYILPSVRFLKSSVGGGGYQLIPGVLFGWGK